MTEVIEQNNIINQRLNQDQFNFQLVQFTGTDQWYRHNLNRNLIYTDGVKFLAENGGEQGAYWFIDKIACEIAPLLKSKNERFGVITLCFGLTDANQAMINNLQLIISILRICNQATGNFIWLMIRHI